MKKEKDVFYVFLKSIHDFYILKGGRKTDILDFLRWLNKLDFSKIEVLDDNIRYSSCSIIDSYFQKKFKGL